MKLFICIILSSDAFADPQKERNFGLLVIVHVSYIAFRHIGMQAVPKLKQIPIMPLYGFLELFLENIYRYKCTCR